MIVLWATIWNKCAISGWTLDFGYVDTIQSLIFTGRNESIYEQKTWLPIDEMVSLLIVNLL